MPGHVILATPSGTGGNPIPVSAANPLPVNASVVATAQTVAKATAAAPSYVEGDTAAPLSVDLAGGLRITGTINATSATTNTAAAPSYVEGSSNAFSANLAGDLRTISKQSGTWTVQPGNTANSTPWLVDDNNWPDTVDVNSGNKSNSSPRFVIATDNPALALWGHGATSAAVPANATYVGMNVSGNLTGLVGTANGLKVDGSAVTQPVSIATAPVLVAGSAVIGKVGIDQTTPGTTNLVAAGQNGTWTVGISASQSIGVSNFPTTVDTNSGNKSASTLRTLIATDALAVPLWGHGATGASVPANATYIGARTLSATPSDTTAQMNAPVLDLKGSMAVQPYGLGDNVISGLTAAMTGTTSTAVTGIGAPGSGLYNYITTIVVGNSHATVGTFVELQDGSGGTTFFTVPAAAVYGGAVITLPKPLKQPTANTALYCKNTTTGANTIVSVAGFKGP